MTDSGTPSLTATQTFKITVLPVLVTIGPISLTIKKGTLTGISVSLGKGLNTGDAGNAGNYHLVQLVTKGRGKHKVIVVKNLPIKAISYNSTTGLVSITPGRKFGLRGGVYQLRIDGSNIRDSFGRAIDGNLDGKPGGEARFALTRNGATVTTASIPMNLSALDAVLSRYHGKG